MLKKREVTYFHKNLTVKMYFKSDVFPCLLQFSVKFFFRAPPPPTPLYTKVFSPRIWTNLKNDPENVKNRETLIRLIMDETAGMHSTSKALNSRV